MEQAVLPPSVNYHLTAACNMRCHGCFATFHDVRDRVPRGMLPRECQVALVDILATHFDKVTFAGGEPTLCPWLVVLLDTVKRNGGTTMLVTNGSRLDPATLADLAGRLDWLTLSIDSAQPGIHQRLGRALKGVPLEPRRYVEVADAARALGIGVKVNTVVSALNAEEDMRPFIRRLAPERWKLLQMLPVTGQNDGGVGPLLISPKEFRAFNDRHRDLANDGIEVIPEDNAAMTGSYAMVDPAGRFFDNTTGAHRYSPPILDVGLLPAWQHVTFAPATFTNRGGVYEWRR
jgi:radical S-adenosyl methionine domain-containing protein 2